MASTYDYGSDGDLHSVKVADGRPHVVAYGNDVDGQIVRRDESSDYAGGNPHEVWYRFNGVQIGMTGNNWSFDLNYNESVQYRTQVDHGGPYRFGLGSVGASNDFEQSTEKLSSFNQGSVAGGYTVRGGDTLAGIAAGLWGDSALWYKIAEANGLSASSTLSEGQQLRLPAGVMRSSYNAATFTPYNPADAIGDTQPTTPQPQKAAHNKGCGGLGTVLIAVVAVAVAVASHGALTHFAAGIIGQGLGATVVGGALAGAAGSIASQAVGVATGIQEKFSFKGVALAALGGAVGAGLGPGGAFGEAGAFGNIGSKLAGDALRGALGSAATQGIAVATGLQQSFDWAGVAAAGIGAGVGGAIGRGIGFDPKAGGFDARNSALGAAANTAAAIANAATRSAIQGTSFGDNVLAAIPDTIGQALGQLAGSGLATAFDGKSAAIERAAADPKNGGQQGGYTLSDDLESRGIPKDVQEAAYYADKRTVEAIASGQYVQASAASIHPGPQYRSWLDFNNDGHVGLLSDGASLIGSIIRNVTSEEPQDILTSFQDIIVVTGQRIAKVANDIYQSNVNYYQNVYRKTIGPNTAYDTVIARPFYNVVSSVVDIDRIPSDLRNLGSGLAQGKIGWVLGGLPPTLGGGAVSTASGLTSAAGHLFRVAGRTAPTAAPVVTATFSTAEKGILAEARASSTLSRAGYTQLAARLPRNQGFDGVFVRHGSSGAIDDIIITESKYSSTGYASLAESGKGVQLSRPWIDANIKLMRRSPDPAVQQTGRFLTKNEALIRTKANVLNSNGVNRWNRIELPPR